MHVAVPLVQSVLLMCELKGHAELVLNHFLFSGWKIFSSREELALYFKASVFLLINLNDSEQKPL